MQARCIGARCGSSRIDPNPTEAANKGERMSSLNVNAVHTIANIPAVIVGYDAGRGLLLVQHRRFDSLEAMIESYRRNPRGSGSWFAFFKWSAIARGDRDKITRRVIARRQEPRTKGKKKRWNVGSILCGMIVTCTLIKKPTWQAINLSIDFEASPFDIPSRKIKGTSGGSISEIPNRFAERLRGIDPSGRTNLFRPWRG